MAYDIRVLWCDPLDQMVAALAEASFEGGWGAAPQGKRKNEKNKKEKRKREKKRKKEKKERREL